MKKTILNIAAIAVIATTSFIACDKKQANDAADATDSSAIEAPAADPATTDAAPKEEAEVAPAANDSTKTDAAPKVETEVAPKVEEKK